MSRIVMADNDIKQITAGMDGAFYRSVTGAMDYVCAGIGDEFEITYTPSSLEITVGTGEAVMCGRTYKITSEETFSGLTASSTQDLCLRIDLSQSAGNEGRIVMNSQGNYTQENLNSTGSIYDMPLYRITTSAGGVTGVTDIRVIHKGVAVYVGNDGKLYAKYTYGNDEIVKKLGSSEGTATTAQVLAGATFSSQHYDDAVEGEIPTRGAIGTTTLSTGGTTTKNFSAGYYSSAGKVQIDPQTKTATPSLSTQNITPDSGKVLSKVTVNAYTPRIIAIGWSGTNTEHTTLNITPLRCDTNVCTISGNTITFNVARSVTLVTRSQVKITYGSGGYCTIKYVYNGSTTSLGHGSGTLSYSVNLNVAANSTLVIKQEDYSGEPTSYGSVGSTMFYIY